MTRYGSAFIISVVLTLTATAVSAQHFPEELTFPRDGIAEAIDETHIDDHDDTTDTLSGSDQAAILVASDQNYSDGSFTSSNDVYYAADFDDGVGLEQKIRHEMRRDRIGSSRQYLNLSGTLSFPLAGYDFITPGLDWTPVAQYSSGRDGHSALAALDMGPTVLIDVGDLPIFLRGGMSGRRVDSLAAFMKTGEYRQSVGAYGGFRVGSESETLPFAPIYFYTDGLGRRIENSGMALLSSNALGAVETGDGDSLFVYGAASLFNGREGYLEESADGRAAFFAETPWRVERNVTFMVGYKIGRWDALEPSVYYSVEQNVLEFPNDTRLRDESTLRQTVSGALATDSSAGIHYSGAIGFTWRDHDKLFGQKNMPVARTQSNADSLEINRWDYAAFDPRTSHKITVRLPMSLRAIYDLNVARYLTEYPNFYTDGADTVRNSDDNDRRMLSHRVALVYQSDTTLRAELFGEQSTYDLVFLRSAKSSGSRRDLGQKIGLVFDWAPTDALSFSETVAAEAKRGEFLYPEYHQDAAQRPRYSRAVSSSLCADWQTTERVGLMGKWDIKYSDFGFWYGRDYMQDALAADPNARVDYYAVAAKSVYTTIDAAVSHDTERTRFEIGNAFTMARDHNYSGGYYILTTEDAYSTKPYVNAAASVGETAEMSAHVSRTFVIGNSGLDYWDFRIHVTARF